MSVASYFIQHDGLILKCTHTKKKKKKKKKNSSKIPALVLLKIAFDHGKTSLFFPSRNTLLPIKALVFL